MNLPAKIALRGLAVLACLALLIVAGQIFLVLHPGLILRHHISHGIFQVYSAKPIPSEMSAVLDRAAALVSASDLYDPSLTFDVCLCQGTKTMKRFLLREVHFAAVLPTGAIFVTWGDPITNTARWRKPEEGSSPIRTLSGVLAHEMTHNLIRRRVGFTVERRLPTWLKEGYADIIAHDSAIDPATGVEILLERGPDAPRLRHFPSRVMVDYLIFVKGRSATSLLDDPPSYRETVEAAIASLREDPAAVISRLTENDR